MRRMQRLHESPAQCRGCGRRRTLKSQKVKKSKSQQRQPLAPATGSRLFHSSRSGLEAPKPAARFRLFDLSTFRLLSGASRNPQSGFTLIEFLVVITIIGILAALIVPRFFGRVEGAKKAVAQQKIAVLEAKVAEFQLDCGRYPTMQEGLRALVQRPADVGDKWNGPYVKEKDIIDPWGAEIMYRRPGRYNADFDLFSYGADGVEGGEAENEDIGNW
jgi:general secretion pathway protein G